MMEKKPKRRNILIIALVSIVVVVIIFFMTNYSSSIVPFSFSDSSTLSTSSSKSTMTSSSPSVLKGSNENRNKNENKNSIITTRRSIKEGGKEGEKSSFTPVLVPPPWNSFLSAHHHSVDEVDKKKELKQFELFSFLPLLGANGGDVMNNSRSSRQDQETRRSDISSDKERTNKKIIESFFFDEDASSWCHMESELSQTSARRKGSSGYSEDEESSTASSEQQKKNQEASLIEKILLDGANEANENTTSFRETGCPISHSITCGLPPTSATINSNKNENNNNNNKNNVEEIIFTPRKSRALVIYMVTSAKFSHQREQENSNLDYFIEHGGIVGGGPTALFDEVDYVFARVQINNEKTEESLVDCGSISSTSVKIDDDSAEEDDVDEINRSSKKKDAEKVEEEEEHAMMMKFSSFFSDIRGEDLSTEKSDNMKRTWNKLRKKLIIKKKNENNKNSIRFLLLPKGPCDLCAHARVLKYLGVFDDNSLHRNQKRRQYYNQFFLLNSGVRGPYFHSSSSLSSRSSRNKPTTWLDFVTMAGRDKITNPRFDHLFENRNCIPDIPPPDVASNKIFSSSASSVSSSSSMKIKEIATYRRLVSEYADKQAKEVDPRILLASCPTQVASSTSISWEIHMHPQTFFLSFPRAILQSEIYPLFSSTCSNPKKKKGGPKTVCILRGEVAVGYQVLGPERKHTPNWALHSLSKRFNVRDFRGVDSRMKRQEYYVENTNPSYRWTNPCMGVFVKHGGDAHKRGRLPQSVVRAARELEDFYYHNNNNNDDGKNSSSSHQSTFFSYWKLMDRILDPALNRRCRRQRKNV